jgi:hypothetical protein
MSCTKPELAPARDRYTTFAGIDFDGQTRRVIERIELHTLHASQPDPFWAYFHKRRHATSGVRCDDLLLLASFVNQVRELFESRADEVGLAMLDQIEDECF